MKKLNVFFLLAALFMLSCSTSKKGEKSVQNKPDRMEFTVTKIQNEMDGQTIFMEDDKDGRFMTIISPANGNWIDLKIGDKISLVAEEIMELGFAALAILAICLYQKYLSDTELS